MCLASSIDLTGRSLQLLGTSYNCTPFAWLINHSFACPSTTHTHTHAHARAHTHTQTQTQTHMQTTVMWTCSTRGMRTRTLPARVSPPHGCRGLSMPLQPTSRCYTLRVAFESPSIPMSTAWTHLVAGTRSKLSE